MRAAVSLLVAAGLLVAAPVAWADPSVADWARLRMCESTDTYTVVSADGRYFGAYQFDLPTWRSVGGAGLPSQAGQSEQDYRALYLYRMRGWQPWECAGKLGLAPDADAGSGRAPSRADSAYIAVPIWPGRVYLEGDCAPELAVWQRRVNQFGYQLAADGCYDSWTYQAVKDVQAANDIRVTGQLGRQTWNAVWIGNRPVT
ncbi:transglycosylase family protein [Kutzneria viridogrisea]|uniref:Peptidoglycan binding-like domain-containing protein n=2 Tax=Kutzneria TaxID=43356 RepID=W5WAJ4_9PSEU|nr:transglycosylase family protein [Kutzneria albida]AHH97770.1 hypothetical protein KALB_4408 [Kutzneria albida DSM 43870]MBA8924643.1 hypothetical protein [Kutzneria viridogrisea]